MQQVPPKANSSFGEDIISTYTNSYFKSQAQIVFPVSQKYFFVLLATIQGNSDKAKGKKCWVSTNLTDPISAQPWIFFLFFSFFLSVTKLHVKDGFDTKKKKFKKKKKKNSRPTDPSNFGPVSGNPSFFFRPNATYFFGFII